MFSLSSYELALIKASLNLFISNDFDGVSKKVKSSNDSLALCLITKLNNFNSNITAEDLRIMYISLFNFQIFISEGLDSGICDIDLIKDSNKFNSIIDQLLLRIKKEFKKHGIDIDNY